MLSYWQKTGRMIGPISRLKDVIVSSHRRGSLIGSSSSSERLRWWRKIPQEGWREKWWSWRYRWGLHISLFPMWLIYIPLMDNSVTCLHAKSLISSNDLFRSPWSCRCTELLLVTISMITFFCVVAGVMLVIVVTMEVHFVELPEFVNWNTEWIFIVVKLYLHSLLRLFPDSIQLVKMTDPVDTCLVLIGLMIWRIDLDKFCVASMPKWYSVLTFRVKLCLLSSCSVVCNI